MLGRTEAQLEQLRVLGYEYKATCSRHLLKPRSFPASRRTPEQRTSSSTAVLGLEPTSSYQAAPGRLTFQLPQPFRLELDVASFPQTMT